MDVTEFFRVALQNAVNLFRLIRCQIEVFGQMCGHAFGIRAPFAVGA